MLGDQTLAVENIKVIQANLDYLRSAIRYFKRTQSFCIGLFEI